MPAAAAPGLCEGLGPEIACGGGWAGVRFHPRAGGAGPGDPSEPSKAGRQVGVRTGRGWGVVSAILILTRFSSIPPSSLLLPVVVSSPPFPRTPLSVLGSLAVCRFCVWVSVSLSPIAVRSPTICVCLSSLLGGGVCPLLGLIHAPLHFFLVPPVCFPPSPAARPTPFPHLPLRGFPPSPSAPGPHSPGLFATSGA